MDDSIAMRKAKGWYTMLSPLAKVEFLEYLYKTDAHKYEYAKLNEPLRRFYNGTVSRPTHQEEE